MFLSQPDTFLLFSFDSRTFPCLSVIVSSPLFFRYCDSRRKVLLDHVHEGYDQDWWLYTEEKAKSQ